MGKKIVRYPNLIAEMARNGESQVTIAELLGISKATVSLKITGKHRWTLEEVDAICEHYKKDYKELFK